MLALVSSLPGAVMRDAPLIDPKPRQAVLTLVHYEVDLVEIGPK